MLFNSLQYALFLPLLTAVYFWAPRSWRLVILLVGSYVFYAAWNPAYLLLIIAMTAANYVFGLLLGRTSGRPAGTRWLILAVSMNVAVIGYYKYTAFLLASVEGLLRSAGFQIVFPQPSIILPLAISFFTFEFIHYVVDVWAGHPPERGFLKFAVFAAFFPTQIAGPIKRYEAFIPQLDLPSRFEWARAGEGLQLITWGLFKKIVLADRLGAMVSLGFPDTGHAALNPVDAWVTVLAFAMQIYLDFSGYTDIGRGSAVILGFSVPENFRRPYLASSISEFWRRWHISLSTWLRDYLFVPLGGLRGHPARALLVTMALAGLWHGAGWHFVAWGLFHGVLLTGHWMIRAWRARHGGAARRAEGVRLVPGWLLTFGLVSLSYAFFRASSMGGALRMIADMFGSSLRAPAVLHPDQQVLTAGCVAGILLVELFLELRDRGVTARFQLFPRFRTTFASSTLRVAGYVMLWNLIVLFPHGKRAAFIYFQF